MGGIQQTSFQKTAIGLGCKCCSFQAVDYEKLGESPTVPRPSARSEMHARMEEEEEGKEGRGRGVEEEEGASSAGATFTGSILFFRRRWREGGRTVPKRVWLMPFLLLTDAKKGGRIPDMSTRRRSRSGWKKWIKRAGGRSQLMSSCFCSISSSVLGVKSGGRCQASNRPNEAGTQFAYLFCLLACLHASHAGNWEIVACCTG